MSSTSARRRPFPHAAAPVALALLLVACGGGNDPATPSVAPPPFADGADAGAGVDGPAAEASPSSEPESPAGPDPLADTARYRITLKNLWGADGFPQDFPDGAHLSLVGGALHDDSVSFWAPGRVVTPGMEDLAETGRIDQFLAEDVAPAIASGAAGSRVAVREFTGPMVDGVPGRLAFELEANERWPLLTLATMLGPSPDWFVGTSGLALATADAGWTARVAVDLPLYDGGSKSDIVPVMGGPDIIPPEPVALVAYDPVTGTYLPSDAPQTVARLVIERVR